MMLGLLSLALAGSVVHSRETQEPAGDARVVPFKIHVPDSVLVDLKQRLTRVRYPDEIENADWQWGTNRTYLKELMTYWRDRFDWRAREQRLNEFDQFMTDIEGVNIHFIHQRSTNPDATPLLLLNGWPSSIYEYSKVIRALTDPARHNGSPNESFHVIVPSMPGYGFSDAPRAAGYDTQKIAELWKQLMARLGYNRYGVVGSDWGLSVATRLAVSDASHVTALHLAGCDAVPPLSPNPGETPMPNRSAGEHIPQEALGYVELQSTKPQTVGYGLSDSPVSLAAWILEKYHDWSDLGGGDIEQVYTKDDLLTQISIYWVTNTGTSSARLYYENQHPNGKFVSFIQGFLPPLPEAHVNVPTACTTFGAGFTRREAVETANFSKRYNVVRRSSTTRGGHFAALEQPSFWVDDVRSFFVDQR
jgi:pimeloyl-ACP methyl ester carboxylesterase